MDLQRPIGYFPKAYNAKYPHSTLESSMMRTIHPKYVSYFGDGSGRDKYIIHNNGGLTNSDKNCFVREAFRNTLRDTGAKPQKHAISIKY